ncbi:MAG: SURF1 family protein [Rhodanobacter sp.]
MTGFRRPSWWALLLTIAGSLLFIRLGVWQLHRADFKEALLRRYAAASTAPVQEFSAVAANPPADSFPRVQVRGRYLVNRLYLLDNPHHDERGGVEVFAPLQIGEQQALLLVDLGFLPGDGSGKTPPLPPLSNAEVDLRGLYTPPPPTGFEMGGDALARQTRWPKDSIYLAPAQVARDLGRPLYPRVLALDAEAGSVYVRRHSLDLTMPPVRHRAYAFQWFSFALAAVVILLVLHRKRVPPPPDRTTN